MGVRGSRELRESQCFGGYSGERNYPGSSEFYQAQLGKLTSDETKSKLDTDKRGRGEQLMFFLFIN